MRPLIIERPQKQTRSQRWGYRAITVLFWALFAYFIRPVLTLAAWLLGYYRFQEIMIGAHGWEELVRLLLVYSAVILTMTLVLIGWSLYNLVRFGRHEKRVTPPARIPTEVLAEHFGVSAEQVRHWQNARRLVIHYNDEGAIVDGHSLSD